MGFIEAIVSGIVQGLTEFLPVSSSGHLVILHRLLGLKEPQLVFDIFVHIGTLLAVFIVFRKDLLDTLTNKKKLGLFLLISTLATGIFVAFFGKGIEAAFSANVKFVGAMLIVTGIWLILGSFIKMSDEPLTGFKAFLIGIAQGVSALPGISRSGATISTGLFLGLDPYSSARFSFLLSIPAVLGAFLLKLKQGAFEGEFNVNYIFALIISCITGILALKLVLKTLYRNKLHFFGVYCVVAGFLTIVFL